MTMVIIVISLLREKKISNFKTDNKNMIFPTQLCLGSISETFDYVESKGVSFKGNVYDFSVDFKAIVKCETLNIDNYLMVQNNIK